MSERLSLQVEQKRNLRSQQERTAMCISALRIVIKVKQKALFKERFRSTKPHHLSATTRNDKRCYSFQYRSKRTYHFTSWH